jgi:N-acetylglucosamine-6-phosphate deacetylase
MNGYCFASRFSGNNNDAPILTTNIPNMINSELMVVNPRSATYSPPSIFRPMKVSKAANPIFRKRNLSIIFTSKKNIERKPRMAKILEKKTIYGSLVIEKTAGMESTANTRSVTSMINNTNRSGVISFLPSTLTTNLLPAKCGDTAKYFEANLTTA